MHIDKQHTHTFACNCIYNPQHAHRHVHMNTHIHGHKSIYTHNAQTHTYVQACTYKQIKIHKHINKYHMCIYDTQYTDTHAHKCICILNTHIDMQYKWIHMHMNTYS